MIMQKKQWLNYKSTTIHTTVPYIYKKQMFTES